MVAKKVFKIPELSFSSEKLRTLSSNRSEVPNLGELVSVDLDGEILDRKVIGLEFTTNSNYVGVVISEPIEEKET
jgi:hypothetical protein